MSKETNEEIIARLQQQLKQLKAMLPEHCSGTESYTSTHRASTAHWLKIEEIEEQIKTLQAQ